MDTIEQEVKRIKNELADLGCQMMYGKSAQEIVQELIQEILAGMAEQVDARDFGEIRGALRQETSDVNVG